MPRFGHEPRDATVTLYSWRGWTGPGRSHWYESFRMPGDYEQTHRVHERRLKVPYEFAKRVADCVRTGDVMVDIALVREAKREGWIAD